MTAEGSLSRREQKDLEKSLERLRADPRNAHAAGRIGYLLHKAGRGEESLPYYWTAFNRFLEEEQFSRAVMIADELLSVRQGSLEMLHRLSRLADRKDLEIPVLRIYEKYKAFYRLPLFRQLEAVDFLHLLRAADYHDIRENRAFLREGARGRDLFLLVEGRVRVLKRARGGSDVLLGGMEVGDFMGEIACMSAQRRSATLVTEGPCRLLSWTDKTIRSLSRKCPHVTRVLFDAFQERSLNTVMCLSPLFAHMSMEKRREIMSCFIAKEYLPHEAILRQGEQNEEGVLFLVRKGEAEVFRGRPGAAGKPIALLTAGDLFGEYSVITGKPATATVMTRTPVEVLALKRSDLLKILREDARAVRVLERIGKNRFPETILSLSYFRAFEALSGS